MNAPQRIELIEPTETVDLSPRPSLPLAQVQQIAPMASPSPLALLEAFLQRPDIDLDRAERLLQMGRDMRREESRLAFKDDFAKFKALNIVIPKSKKVKQTAKGGGPGPRYEQTELEFVSGLLSPALAQYGFSFRFDPVIERKGNRAEWVSITCHLEHRMGYAEQVTMGGPPDDSGSKNAQQEVQSTVTFWERHTLLAVTGTPQAGMDNDGRGAKGYEDDEQGEQQQATDAPLLQKGRYASLNGMESLNAWWQGLTGKERDRLTPEFGSLRGAARKADEAGKGRAAP